MVVSAQSVVKAQIDNVSRLVNDMISLMGPETSKGCPDEDTIQLALDEAE